MNAPSGEIDHINYLSDHIGSLFLNEEYSDVSLIIEGELPPVGDCKSFLIHYKTGMCLIFRPKISSS